MLNEPASSVDRTPNSRPALLSAEQNDNALFDELRVMVSAVLAISSSAQPDSGSMPIDETMLLMGRGAQRLATFTGQLLMDSESAYDKLDAMLAPQSRVALFRERDGQHIIHILDGRANPRPRAWWLNLVLLIATSVSVLIVGANIAIFNIKQTNIIQGLFLENNFWREIWRGWPYAVSILLILGAHEMGHYFAARRHKLAVTLPYFIPLPFYSPFGTLGAFIQLRQPIRNRKVLFDVGASGPLAGLIFAVPILFIGLASQTPQPLVSFGESLGFEGDSILYAFAKTITYGHYVPAGNMDICVTCSQLTWAGWTGLLVTAMNLFPLGQLDGGHVLYAAFGDRARKLYYPLLLFMVVLLLFASDVWWLWIFLLIFMGRIYAQPLDNITPLNPPRRWLAILTMVIFVLIFVPAPLSDGRGMLGALAGVAVIPMMIPAILARLSRVFHAAEIST